MMPITPSGTRICPTRMPEGWVRNSPVSPTGSGSAATCSTPRAIDSTDLSVRVRRSTNAASLPAALAPATSCAFAARIGPRSRRMAAAMAARERFLVAVSARAIARDASRARRPISCIVLRTSTGGKSPGKTRR